MIDKVYRSVNDYAVRVPYGTYKVTIDPIEGYSFRLDVVEMIRWL